MELEDESRSKVWEIQRLRPIPIPTRTSVSSDARPLIRRYSSHSTTPFSKRRNRLGISQQRIELVSQTKGKYPNSSPRLTCSPSSTVVWMLSTIIAPTHTAMMRPKAGLSMGTILSMFCRKYQGSSVCLEVAFNKWDEGNRRRVLHRRCSIYTWCTSWVQSYHQQANGINDDLAESVEKSPQRSWDIDLLGLDSNTRQSCDGEPPDP